MAFLIVRPRATLVTIFLAGLLLPVAVHAREVAGLDPDGWKWLPELPDSLNGHQAVVTGKALVVVGGRNRMGKIQKSVYRASLRGNGTYKGWKREPDTPFGIAGFALAVVGNHAYAVGGMRLAARGEEISGDVWMADVAGDGGLRSWRHGPDLPDPVYAHTMVVHGKWLYVMGGMGVEGHRSAVLRGEIGANGVVPVWEDATRLPAPLAHCSAAAVGDYLIVAGGQSPAEGKTLAMPTVYVGPVMQDGSIQTWYMATSRFPGSWLGYGRSQAALVGWKNAVFAIGGQDASWFYVNNIALSTIDVASGEMSNWGISDAPKDMPQSAACAAGKDVVYLVSGLIEGRASGKVMMGRFRTVEGEEAE